MYRGIVHIYMTNQEITQNQLKALLSDAEYLLDEAEALKYVIDSVPYTESESGELSIYNMLKLVDHAQVSYYRPIIEKGISDSRPIKLSHFEHYRETFEEVTDKDEMNVQKVLSKIIKHRAAVLNLFKKISLIDWEREVRGENGESLILFDVARRMISEEKITLKKVADLVLYHQKEMSNQINQQKSS